MDDRSVTQNAFDKQIFDTISFQRRHCFSFFIIVARNAAPKSFQTILMINHPQRQSVSCIAMTAYALASLAVRSTLETFLRKIPAARMKTYGAMPCPQQATWGAVQPFKGEKII